MMIILGGAGAIPTTTTSSVGVATPTIVPITTSLVVPSKFSDSWLYALLMLVSSAAAAIAAWFSYRTAHNSYIQSLLNTFIELESKLALGNVTRLNKHQKELFCNYFEMISHLIHIGKISDKDVVLITEVMRMTMFISFIRSYRLSHGQEYYKYYWAWLKKHSHL